MSYDLKVFRKEVRNEHNSLEFLVHESSIVNFSKEDKEILRKRLNHYNYRIENKTDNAEVYHYDNGKYGITAILLNYCLTFRCAGLSENGIFEILQTASELCDDDFALLDIQEGKWVEEREDKKAEDPTKYYISFEGDGAIIRKGETKPWWKIW